MDFSFDFPAFKGSMEERLKQRDGPPEENVMNKPAGHSNLISQLIAERIRYQEELRQREMASSAVAIVKFRIPAAMVDILVGEEDQQALFIAFMTETELELPRRYQNPTFVVSGYEHNIRKALWMIEEIINKEFCYSNSSPYAFVPDPNVDQSGTDYILCNGPVHEARYRPGREGMHRG